MTLRGRNLVISSQIFIMLAFFIGMLLNYYSLAPILREGEDARLLTDIDRYTSHFFFEEACDVRDKAQLDSVLALNLDPYGGELYIMDGKGVVIYAQDGATGDGVASLTAKYGQNAANILHTEYSDPSDKSTMEYVKDTHTSLYACFLPRRDLMFFYAVDYWIAGSDLLKTFFVLLLFMSLGGIIVLIVGYLIIRRLIRQERQDLVVQKELDTASAIQKSMLPHGEKRLIQLDVDARLVPARKVGGDFYSFLLSEGILYFCIGDVSGKGVPASLFMSKAVTLFRILAKSGLSPAALATRMNDELCMNNEHNMFITGIVGTMNSTDGYMTYVNAGHELPVIWDGKSDSKLSYLECDGNIPFGVIPESEFVEEHYIMENNGMLLLYTDGVSEAKSGRKGLLGREALLRMIEPSKSLTAKEINDNIMAYISEYESGIEQSDDITLLTLRNIKKPKVLKITNAVPELRKISAFTGDILKECELDRKERIRVRSGLDEAMTNCVHYAYDSPGNEIEVSATIDHHRLIFTLTDSGKPFNPLEYNQVPSSELRVGGLGISMYKSSFDKVLYERRDDKNILTLIKNV